MNDMTYGTIISSGNLKPEDSTRGRGQESFVVVRMAVKGSAASKGMTEVVIRT